VGFVTTGKEAKTDKKKKKLHATNVGKPGTSQMNAMKNRQIKHLM